VFDSRWTLALALVAAVCAPAAARAQQPQGQAGGQGAQAAPTGEITLVYEREVYTYRGENRRDPFRPLTDDDAMGPRFEELVLQGIIYSTGRGRSVALLGDGNNRIYRVRVGDVVGNARVVEIGPLRVVLAVENFGTIRQEMLELPKRGGADR
jgi:hypothetical protein